MLPQEKLVHQGNLMKMKTYLVKSNWPEKLFVNEFVIERTFDIIKYTIYNNIQV